MGGFLRVVSLGFFVLALGVGLGVTSAQARDIRIFAAASTTTALRDLISVYESENPDVRVLAAFAASSTLAKQVVNGAPADIFLSASRQWMDYVRAEGAVDSASVADLLSNRLVLIAPVESHWTVEIEPGVDLRTPLARGYLSMGDPDHVPAGIYGRETLTSLGLWPQLSGRIARAANVRAALVLVERGEAAAGIVYATDAAISDRVRVVGTFPRSSHTPIVYPVALVDPAASRPVRRFFEFLRSPRAADAWGRQGFALVSVSQAR